MRKDSSSEIQPQVYRIEVSSSVKDSLKQALANLSCTYATFSSEEDFSVTSKYSEKRVLTRVRIIETENSATSAIIVVGPENVRQNERRLELPSTITTAQLKVELVKAFRLQSLWIGVVSRLGCCEEELANCLSQQYGFTVSNINTVSEFLKIVDKGLGSNPSNKALKTVLEKAETQLDGIVERETMRVENMVQNMFQERIVISGVTQHKYLSLLATRNYFHLINLESPDTLSRYTRFRESCKYRYPVLESQLSLEAFIQIDDWIYCRYIRRSAHEIRFSLCANSNFNQLVQALYRRLVRSFRTSEDEYFLSICRALKRRAACLKEAVGSVLVKNKRILATGYNGTPYGCKNCFNGGCPACHDHKMGINTEVRLCSCLHSQYSCVAEAGIHVAKGGTLYSTKLPCLWCAKLIIQARIKRVVHLRVQYESLQHNNVVKVKKLFQSVGIEVLQVQDESSTYYNHKDLQGDTQQTINENIAQVALSQNR